MDKDLEGLKSVLRSLVVSSPSQVDARSLIRDYRQMMGAPIPLAKFGYKEILPFLRERCGDCFLGPSSNPVLTLIVPDTLKHIDQFVQRQKCSTITKMKGKRMSVKTPTRFLEKPKFTNGSNVICQTFTRNLPSTHNINYHTPEVRSNNKPPEVKSNHSTEVKSNYHTKVKSNHPTEVKSNHPTGVKSNYHLTEVKSNNDHQQEVKSKYDIKSESVTRNSNFLINKTYNGNKEDKPSIKPENNENLHRVENKYKNSASDLLKKCQQIYDSSLSLDTEQCTESNKPGDSGKQTLSSGSSAKRAQLEELKAEVHTLIKENENGILCTQILRLYRERYRRELDLSRFGHNNINSLLGSMEERVRFVQEPGGVRVRDAHAPPGPARAPDCAYVRVPQRYSMRALPIDPDDALPGIDFEPDVFPADCMQFAESIPLQSLAEIVAGAMLEVAVGEVYSPSHFWLQRIGLDHSQAMEDVMDEMSVYYGSAAGKARELTRGAVRVGHYCASVYEGDWHRSLIVKIVDSDTVKVRHVDYGTVDAVRVSSLKPLLRAWGALPAQGLRARLAGLRPVAGGARWPHAAAAHFLHLVRDTRFVANVVAVDHEELTIETFLIDTRGADDVCVSTEIVRAGYADPRSDSALRSGECYLYPRFEALESAATPNYGAICRYLADGISLEYVAAYRDHVPALVYTAPAPPAPALLRLRLDSPSPPPATESPTPVVSSPVPPDPEPAPPSPEPAPPSPAAASPRAAPAPKLSSHTSREEPHAAARAPAALRPPPGAPAPWGSDVGPTLSEGDVFEWLNKIDPETAQYYRLTTLRRAYAVGAGAPPRPHAAGAPLAQFAFNAPAPPQSYLNPHAPEFRVSAPPGLSAPPGFWSPPGLPLPPRPSLFHPPPPATPGHRLASRPPVYLDSSSFLKRL